jgi:hypothetical protein
MFFLGLLNRPLEEVDGQKGATNASVHKKMLFVIKQIGIY